MQNVLFQNESVESLYNCVTKKVLPEGTRLYYEMRPDEYRVPEPNTTTLRTEMKLEFQPFNNF